MMRYKYLLEEEGDKIERVETELEEDEEEEIEEGKYD